MDPAELHLEGKTLLRRQDKQNIESTRLICRDIDTDGYTHLVLLASLVRRGLQPYGHTLRRRGPDN